MILSMNHTLVACLCPFQSAIRGHTGITVQAVVLATPPTLNAAAAKMGSVSANLPGPAQTARRLLVSTLICAADLTRVRHL